jgi:hypothetical protein
MARGITAFIFVVALVFSMTILSSVGYFAAFDIQIDAESHNEDVVNAAAELDGIEFGEGRSGSILEGPLAAITPVVGVFQTFTTVILNTSGVLQLLYGLPAAVADTIELFGKIAMLITMMFVIRSGASV